MTAGPEPLDFELGPRDPFIGPDDPSAAMDGPDSYEPPAPLSAQERADVMADLAELMEFSSVLSPRGIRGVVVECEDCHEPHYFGWALIQANLRELLGAGQVHAHEPACAPDSDSYVSWDYARGFTDALTRG